MTGPGLLNVNTGIAMNALHPWDIVAPKKAKCYAVLFVWETSFFWDGEMAQQLRALSTLSENLGSVPSIHMAPSANIPRPWEYIVLFWPPWIRGMKVVPTHVIVHKLSHTHKIIRKYIFSKFILFFKSKINMRN